MRRPGQHGRWRPGVDDAYVRCEDQLLGRRRLTLAALVHVAPFG